VKLLSLLLCMRKNMDSTRMSIDSVSYFPLDNIDQKLVEG